MNDRLIFELPTLTPMPSGTWELTYDWTVVFKGKFIHIAKGFSTDGASIPRILWRLCGTPMDIPRLYAAIVHDYLYSGGEPSMTRQQADEIFRDLQIELAEMSADANGLTGIKRSLSLASARAKAYTEYYSLRLFGGGHWYQ